MRIARPPAIRMPEISASVNVLLFLVAAVSICGLPPFNGFVSEWFIYRGLFSGACGGGGTAAGAVIALGSLALMGGLALACFAKVFSVVFLGQARDAGVHPHPTPNSMCLAMALPAGLCLLIGVLPGRVMPLAARALSSLAVVPASNGSLP